MELLAIIPARGGSKRVPRKNIRKLGNKPLIEWTIDCALNAEAVDRVIVTTDDIEIANVSQLAGAEVPFMRPAELAQDTSDGVCYIFHALQWLRENEEYVPDAFVELQVTTPLRECSDIDNAYRIFVDKSADSVVSVCEPLHNPYWMKKTDQNGRLISFIENNKIERHQDLPPVYSLNGAVYLSKTKSFIRVGDYYTEKTYPYIMPQEKSIDIDTEFDFTLAEFLISNPV